MFELDWMSEENHSRRRMLGRYVIGALGAAVHPTPRASPRCDSAPCEFLHAGGVALLGVAGRFEERGLATIGRHTIRGVAPERVQHLRGGRGTSDLDFATKASEEGAFDQRRRQHRAAR